MKVVIQVQIMRALLRVEIATICLVRDVVLEMRILEDLYVKIWIATMLLPRGEGKKIEETGKVGEFMRVLRARVKMLQEVDTIG